MVSPSKIPTLSSGKGPARKIPERRMTRAMKGSVIFLYFLIFLSFHNFEPLKSLSFRSDEMKDHLTGRSLEISSNGFWHNKMSRL